MKTFEDLAKELAASILVQEALVSQLRDNERVFREYAAFHAAKEPQTEDTRQKAMVNEEHARMTATAIEKALKIWETYHETAAMILDGKFDQTQMEV